MTKTLIAASLIVAGFASAASASEGFLYPNASFQQPVAQQHYTVSGSQAYAYAPAIAERQSFGVTNAETREFNRVAIDTVSSR